MDPKEPVQYHLDISRDQIKSARHSVVVGDPDRVPFLAEAFDSKAVMLANHRGYVTYLANFQGESIVISTTGIGGPSTSIVVEELANLGIKSFLRVGTTGAIQPYINLGDLIITQASVRLDGASTHYAPIEFPAVASIELTCAAINAAKELKVPYHVGVTVSSDTFYPGQERYENFAQYVIKRFQGTLQEWQKLKALNYEMESATLLTMCKVLGLEAACFCGVIANRNFSEKPSTDTLSALKEVWAKMAVKTIENSLNQ